MAGPNDAPGRMLLAIFGSPGPATCAILKVHMHVGSPASIDSPVVNSAL